MAGRKLTEALSPTFDENEVGVKQIVKCLDKAQKKAGGVANVPIRYQPY